MNEIPINEIPYFRRGTPWPSVARRRARRAAEPEPPRRAPQSRSAAARERPAV